MDELTESLASSFQVSDIPNNTAAAHPRYSQYKTKSNLPNQHERRRKLLELQKQKRYDYVNHIRRLAENDWSLDIRDDASILFDEDRKCDDEEMMDWLVQYCKPPRFYKNQLMLSEWLVEIPDDLLTEWLLVLCPQGKRCLVVAAKGKTIAYTKSGCRVNTFPSLLPGGNRQQQLKSGNYTLLDCVFNLQNRTYYVLDVLCWRGHPVLDSETEFRFYWLHEKMSEIPDIQTQSKINQYSFVPLPSYPCVVDGFQQLLESLPFAAPLDGLLFYHKRSHYLHGVNPLVGWLQAYMLPEMFGINIPEHYAAEKPSSYTCMSEHLKVAFDKVRERKCRMDFEGCDTADGDKPSYSKT